MNRRGKLLEWVEALYAGRTIKRTTLPYMHHLISVAEMVKNAGPLAYEIGLCHDLLEDLEIKAEDLQQALVSFGYMANDATKIVGTVLELTDVYTSQAYPSLTKKQRKQKEEQRLMHMSPDAQTIKYADLVYNANWVRNYQPKKLEKYLERKHRLVIAMDKGDPDLRRLAIAALN